MSYVASPAVRKYAGDRGVDLAAVAARTGREKLGREDIDRHLSGGDSAPASADPTRYWSVDHAAHGPVTEEPMGRLSRLAADNLQASASVVPQVTHHDRADMGAIEALRANLREEAAARGLRLTALAFHVKALARCLRDFPRFNASLSPDGQTLTLKHYIHIGIAVDTPNGLMVPVIRNAGRKGLWAIAADIADLAGRAQARKLRSDEMGGASMTISNLGGIGGTAFTPIVNPPELGILGITRTSTEPVWDGQTFCPRPICPLDLSYDHRVINGADAAKFLSRHAALISEPRRLLL